MDRDEWLALRRQNVGASEVAALFGCQAAHQQSHWTLWQVKAGRIPDPFVGNERVAWGLKLEQVIAEAARERHGWYAVVRAQYVQHETVAGMGCTPDFYILDGGKAVALLETKNVDWLVRKRQWGDEPPMHILLQLQHQLACTGKPRGCIAALVGGNELRTYEYERRPKLVAEIERRVTEFWRSIEEGREPPIDGSASTADAVAALYPHDDGDDEPADMTGDNELPDLCARLLRLSIERRDLQTAEQAARSAILAKLGDHRAARCMGFVLRAARSRDTPDRVIAPEMVGETIKGRAGSRRLTVREMT